MNLRDIILRDTITFFKHAPVFIPQQSMIAGLAGQKDFNHWMPQVFPNEFLMQKGDDFHFSMGTAFLELGITGIAQKARDNISDRKREDENLLLSGIAETYNAFAEYLSKYIPEINRLITENEDSSDNKRLDNMRNCISNLLTTKPQTFYEAVQLFFLVWRTRCLYANACIGRLDQHLYDFYKTDIENGRITEKDALELLCDLWNRINECGSGDTLINIMVGGSNPDGSDASNELSVLMLKASLLVKKTEPHISVRVHKQIRKDILEIMWKVQLMGHGQASVYNDDILIPALIKNGIPTEYAYKYTNDGCTEVCIDGGSILFFKYVDAVFCINLMLNNGDEPILPGDAKVGYWNKKDPGRTWKSMADIGYASGDLSQMDTFEDLYQAYLRQYKHQTMIALNRIFRCHMAQYSNPCGSFFLNGTFGFVLESGKDIYRGGLPVECLMLFSGSIPTVADSLYAIKRIVFEEQKYTLAEVKKALDCDYKGYEAMRRELLDVPKFGNDSDEVDQLAADIVNHFCDWLNDYSAEKKITVWPALIGWLFLQEAHYAGATPDGRKWRQPIAEHYSATPGRAVNGPTALINSAAKAPLRKCFGVAPVHLSLPRNIIKDEKDIWILESLFHAAMKKELCMYNLAIYDAEQLREAQRDPENHQDLIVRVWGYSARFIDLSREMQEHIINRIL